jgi:HD-like signal output (HDOD) protein
VYGSTRRSIDYGRGTHTLVEDESQQDVLTRLTETLRSPSYEPPILPAAALQLLEITRKSDTSYRDVLRVIEGDPLIAGKVLKIAQSSLYTRGEPVRTIEQALTRLGMGTLAQIFLQVSMTARVFRAPGFEAPMEALRKHSVAVAHAARLIGRQTAFGDELAFLCGLLHDIGAAMCLIILADVKPPKKPPAFEHVKGAIDDAHADASALLCDLWKLPADVRWVLAKHHAPVIQGQPHPLACIIVLADHLASDAGLGFPSEKLYQRDLAMKALGFDAHTWKRIEADFGGLAAALR